MAACAQESAKTVTDSAQDLASQMEILKGRAIQSSKGPSDSVVKGIKDLANQMEDLQAYMDLPVFRIAALDVSTVGETRSGMTWKQNKNWNPKAQAWKQAWPSEQPEKPKTKKEDKEKDKAFFVGYDGKKVPLPSGHVASSGSTSLATTGAANSQVLEENRKLRDVFKLILDRDAGKETGKNPTDLVEECKKLVHNPRESLRERQRELNKEKKSINKAEKLEIAIKEKEDSFVKWKAGFHEMLKAEEKRYEEEVKALREELKLVEEGPEINSMDADSDGELIAKNVAEDLSQVKAQMDQMATYFEARGSAFYSSQLVTTAKVSDGMGDLASQVESLQGAAADGDGR
eukprot:g22251.t2